VNDFDKAIKHFIKFGPKQAGDEAARKQMVQAISDDLSPSVRSSDKEHFPDNVYANNAEDILKNSVHLNLDDKYLLSHPGLTENIQADLLKFIEESEKKLQQVLNACKKMSSDFLNSKEGQEAQSSSWHKEEYSFRLKLMDRIVKGSIDLAFKNRDGTYTLLDYKTNQQIKPELYYNQLAAYAEALAQMKGIKRSQIKCILFYLRYARSVDISRECHQVDLADAVKALNEDNEDI